MSARIRSQAGFSLPEVLIAMTLMLVIMGATLTTLDQARTNQRLDERRTESQENLRRGMDQLQRQLRNLATPASTVKSINRATSTDVIFQTADPQKRWVRYCIDPTDPLVLTGKASLWYSVSNVVSNTPPAATSCPGSGWSSDTSIGQAVVNARNGLNRPVFAFNWPKDNSSNDITTDTSAITQIRTELWVDVSPGTAPPEQRLSSSVFLRNQNQAPVAAFTFSATGRVLNASGTTDFEGRRLNYHWYYGPSAATVPTGCAPADPAVPNAGANIKYLGFGTVQRLPATDITSPQTVTLCVVDPGDLQVTLTKTVTF